MIEVYPDAEALADAAHAAIAAELAQALAARGRASLVGTGGRSPGPVYDRLVPAGLGKPPLPRITLTLSALLNSRALFLLLAGETKRGVIERALAGEDLPVGRLIAQSTAPVRIFWEPGV